ncbi:MAG TPA: hypothetical protein VGQ13_01110 [Nitrososphaera sp.]|jgi:hypothetical protein|nr:hypothetical protein [Nitrososphaera sp.]
MAKKVTAQHIDILFRIAELYNTDYDFQATEWFWGRFHERNIEEFTSKYAHGSREYQFFERFTSKYELAGLLVEKGVLNDDLFFDRYGSLQAEWEKCKPIVYGLREKWKEPHHRENFELLARRGKKWHEKHRSKV